MKTLSLVVIAVSLKHKALSLAGGPSPRRNSPDRGLGRWDPQFVRISSSSRRAWILSQQDRGSILTLRGGNTNDNTDESSSASIRLPFKGLFLSSGSAPSPSSTQSSSYYLIWSPGFVMKFFWASASLWGIHMLQWDTQLSKVVTQQWKGISAAFPLLSSRLATSAAPNVVLPLLSSSCCLLQLLINVMVGAGGCAGFNSILGPVRPLFLAILVSLNLHTGASLRQSLFRYSLALMPEGVHYWNEYRKRQWTLTAERAEATLDRPRVRATIMVDIPTMGCVACINKIESSLRNCAPDSILTASSWLEKDRKGGCAKLEVHVDSESDLMVLSQTVVDTIEGAGFQDSTVTSLEINATLE
ncbi:hypothetical protein IV203_026645 [Nitzschia inconspicua]|uniref:HMA domain-containing protein n=1 Tax=Nitzschia inconspicua TaxID=303405 RepID=A0A9K3LKB5_9STRA|nr:hypothetical protein IV203_026645 [Nitzschia inconspicua]